MKMLRKAVLVVGLVCACLMPATSMAAQMIVCYNCTLIPTPGGWVLKCERCVLVPVPDPTPTP